MITHCPLCGHGRAQHLDLNNEPILCTEHKILLNGDLYDTGDKCGCPAATAILNMPVDEFAGLLKTWLAGRVNAAR